VEFFLEEAGAMQARGPLNEGTLDLALLRAGQPYRNGLSELQWSIGKRAQPLVENRQRKVRAAQGVMPANGWAG